MTQSLNDKLSRGIQRQTPSVEQGCASDHGLLLDDGQVFAASRGASGDSAKTFCSAKHVGSPQPHSARRERTLLRRVLSLTLDPPALLIEPLLS
jgi:hypothetical protein